MVALINDLLTYLLTYRLTESERLLKMTDSHHVGKWFLPAVAIRAVEQLIFLITLIAQLIIN